MNLVACFRTLKLDAFSFVLLIFILWRLVLGFVYEVGVLYIVLSLFVAVYIAFQMDLFTVKVLLTPSFSLFFMCIDALGKSKIFFLSEFQAILKIY